MSAPAHTCIPPPNAGPLPRDTSIPSSTTTSPSSSARYGIGRKVRSTESMERM